MSLFVLGDAGSAASADPVVTTIHGEVPLRHLARGALLRTGDGGVEPVVWVGWRRMAPVASPYGSDMSPICIRAGALAEGVPARDLLVSPDQCLLLGGGLVPARRLCNGTSIAPLHGTGQGIWMHVELARHAVILAQGVPVETWLDTGNRDWFENAPAPLVAVDGNLEDYGAGWDSRRACAPLLDRGAKLLALRTELDRRAQFGLATAARSAAQAG